MRSANQNGAGSLAPIDCRNSTVTIADEQQLERDIEAAKQRMCAAPDYDEKLKHWREMVRLMDIRFPPPSIPTRIAKASVGCRFTAAGGVP